MRTLNEHQYRSKVLGCWLGKNIGGTVGAPFEWKRQKNDVSFYTHALDGNPLPNDDLDIQLLWLIALEEQGVQVDAKVLADYWMLYVTPHWNEYGIAKANMKAGLMPPLSGTAHNPFKHSCGAFIRSEIWACIAPGCPDTAARYAYEDAIIDHGDGEGMYAELFCAALESAAFILCDVDRLIEIGLSYIPEQCGVSGAVRNVIASRQAGLSWEAARDALLAGYRGSAEWFGNVSAEDREKGFDDGKLGWDAPSNIGMLVIGLLYGEGDFARSLSIAVNCGEDTDCTAGTLGALFGIMYGLEAIPQRWIEPIGRGIKTGCLNLGELGYYGDQLPATIDVLTDRVTAVTRRVIQERRLPLALASDRPTDLGEIAANSLCAPDHGASVHGNAGGTVYRFGFFTVVVDYQSDATIAAGETKHLALTITNSYKTPEMLHICWYGPSGAQIRPQGTTNALLTVFERQTRLPVEIALEDPQATNRLVAEITVAGRSTVMLVPVILLRA